MKVEVFKLSIPFLIYPESEWTDSWAVHLYVKVSKGDVVGWGETLVAGSGIIGAYSSVIEELISPVISKFNLESPWDVENILEKLMFTAGTCGVVTGAISSVEMALWDLRAKELGTSVANLLGGKIRDQIPVYASLPRYSRVQDVIEATKKALEKGFSVVKLHQPPGNVLEAVKEIRERIGNEVKLTLDLNAPFDLKEARVFVEKVNRYEIEWVEEPIWPPNDYYSLEKLCRISPVPVAAGENEYTLHGFRNLLEAGVSYLQPDVAKIGGVSKMMKVIDLASSYNVRVAPHDRPDSSPLASVHTLHIASARPEVQIVEYTLGEYPADLFHDAPLVRGGKATVPDGKGIGMTIKEEMIKNYPLTPSLRILKFSDLEGKFKENG